MKCIVKKICSILLVGILTAGMTGCGEKIQLEEQYDVFETTKDYGIGIEKETAALSFYAENLCVGGNENITDDTVTGDLSKASGLFNLKDSVIDYANNIHQRLYPASTTKILTAYVALKYGNLEEITTVSETALQLEEGSTVCGLSAGDQISLKELLYGLMLCSGNDAANVIAEMISGNTQAFAELMNQEALTLGATNSHFINPHGLHDEQHYTTVYDMYLISQAAVENEMFCRLIETKNYQAQFTNQQGETITKEWNTTNRYLKEEEEVPEGVIVIGGKTGTTNDAGYCLVLYSKNSNETPFISIVMKAESRDDLYYQMSELLKKTSN